MAEGSTGMEAEGQSGEDGELPEEAPEAFQCDDGVRVEVRWQSDDDDDYDGEEKGGKGKEKTDGKGKGKKGARSSFLVQLDTIPNASPQGAHGAHAKPHAKKRHKKSSHPHPQKQKLFLGDFYKTGQASPGQDTSTTPFPKG